MKRVLFGWLIIKLRHKVTLPGVASNSKAGINTNNCSLSQSKMQSQKIKNAEGKPESGWASEEIGSKTQGGTNYSVTGTKSLDQSHEIRF